MKLKWLESLTLLSWFDTSFRFFYGAHFYSAIYGRFGRTCEYSAQCGNTYNISEHSSPAWQKYSLCSKKSSVGLTLMELVISAHSHIRNRGVFFLLCRDWTMEIMKVRTSLKMKKNVRMTGESWNARKTLGGEIEKRR